MESLFGFYDPNSTFKESSIEEAINALSLNGSRNHTIQRSEQWIFARANETKPFENLSLLSGFEDESLNYAKAYFDRDQNLILETDLYGLRPLYYAHQNQTFIFSSEIEPLLELLNPNLSLDIDCIKSYLRSGITKEGETFFNEVLLLKPNTKLIFNGEKVSFEKKQKPFQKSIQSSLLDIKLTLEHSLQSWIEKYNVRAANLSAGADTRLLLSLLTPKQRKDFIFYVDASPFLNEQNDKDVLGAKAVAKEFNLNLKVQTHTAVSVENKNLYERSKPAKVLKLSGNHGGEILGADVFTTLHWLYHDESQDVPNDFGEKYIWGIKKLFNPFFTDIYGGGSFNHWTMPQRFSTRKIAPFWSNKLIYLLSQQKSEQLINYNIYKELYLKFSSEFARLPFFSPIASHHNDFKLITSGENQKDSLRKDDFEKLFNEMAPQIKSSRFYDYLTEKENTQHQRLVKVLLWLKTFSPSLL